MTLYNERSPFLSPTRRGDVRLPRKRLFKPPFDQSTRDVIWQRWDDKKSQSEERRDATQRNAPAGQEEAQHPPPLPADNPLVPVPVSRLGDSGAPTGQSATRYQ
eukprot:CAMPEP_0113597692 /NCGR_PEP_ID=MMETSP0015_2-20120614/41162_1 /TAXON_ID=2838 /ORGANISM="Odontella" /LENGTH=103 /DNA_ID=CAMNT_0000505605 /DNA_START=359 /DNA_END=670 /DNA_ORIENTATION=- /assembly_acc=CAM_ASM_000160